MIFFAGGGRISFSGKLFAFVDDLRGSGVPVSPDEMVQCTRALLLVDWEEERSFYAALFSTLIKDSAHTSAFEKAYASHFRGAGALRPADPPGLPAASTLPDVERRAGAEAAGDGSGSGDAGSGQGEGAGGNGSSEAGKGGQREEGRRRRKTLLDKSFESLTAGDINLLEAMVPQVARRLASKMIVKIKKEQRGRLDFRRTFRRSLDTGGVPLELFHYRAVRQKPVVFVLCDVSSSVWQFCCFSLALVHCLERFFRGVRGFAFVDELDEITKLLRRIKPYHLRGLVYREARVINEGRTDYGRCLKVFLQRYGRELTPNSHLLIFGDARNNWYHSEPKALLRLQEKVKKIYWFNPEPERLWNSGDSIMDIYAPCCTRVFSCTNLRELEQAFGSM